MWGEHLYLLWRGACDGRKAGYNTVTDSKLERKTPSGSVGRWESAQDYWWTTEKETHREIDKLVAWRSVFLRSTWKEPKKAGNTEENRANRHKTNSPINLFKHLDPVTLEASYPTELPSTKSQLSFPNCPRPPILEGVEWGVKPI